MADGSVLRRGYVAVEPNVDGFDEKLKEKFKRQDPGGKAGKQLGGQLNRALKRLDLDPIDVKADPKKALAALEVTADRLKLLAANAESVEVKVSTERAITQLNRFRKQLGDTGAQGGNELGGQLNRALQGLDLAPIDIQGNPRDALEAIDDTERHLRQLADSAATVEIKVRTEKALGELSSFRRQIGDVGGEAATGFSARFVARLGPLLASAPVGPAGAALGGVLAVGAAGVVGATIAGAVVGGAGVGGIAGGLILASRDEAVKAAAKDLGLTVVGDLEKRTRGFVPVALDALGQVRAGYAEIGPDLDKIFSASQFTDRFVAGALRGAKGFVSGFAEAVAQSEPVVNALGLSIDRIGTAVGDVFRTLAEDADEGASAITDLTSIVTTFIEISGGIIHAGAAVKGWNDEVDKALDKSRYWLEDTLSRTDALTGETVQLDLTKDGFERGTLAAEAYRKATLGTAQAADFTTLAQAGMTESQIAAIDASGTYRGVLAQLNKEKLLAAQATGTLVATEEALKEKQAASKAAQEDYTRTLDAMGAGAGRAAQLVDGLRKATENLFGAQERQIDANEGYQGSWDALSQTVKNNSDQIGRNKNNLDIHTVAGRSNRDALQGLLTSSRDLYVADIAAGSATDTARRAHENRTKAVREEARRLGLNREETQKLIATYGRIPGKKQTDIVLSKLDGVIRGLMDLYVYQRSLAEGIPVDSVRAALRGEKGPAKRYGGYADGGWTGPGAKHQPAGVVHADEFVIQKESRRKIERQNPGLLDEMNATGQVRGYAAGGLVAPVETRGLLYRLDASDTKIPTRKQVAAKVAPQFGDWPPSPASQRGDSGVWRKVLQLIRTGPEQGSFGNAYRPGDPKWHGSGRAVDWMGYNMDALASYLASKKPLELIHRTNARDYAYTRGVNKGSFNGALMEAHRNHIHIAMAGGGVIGEPVAGVGLRSGNSYSFGERGPETVTPGVQPPGQPTRLHPADIEALARVLARVLAREMRTAVGAGAHAMGRRADVFTRGG